MTIVAAERTTPAGQFADQPPVRLPAFQACGLPALFACAVLVVGILPGVRANPRLLWSIIGAALAMIMWSAALFFRARTTHRVFELAISLRKQHYVQAIAHTSIFLYWGWYWRPVYAAGPLIAAQLLFAYAFDMLLTWSRHDRYTIGFGPFPVIFSTNLFLWFRPDYFYLQFVMVAVGFAGKEMIHWTKEGRSAHIFNPSSFTLTIFSLALLLTGTSDVTFGRDIAITQFYPPHMYLFLFLVALPGQFFFGVTLMTLSAAVTTYLLGLAYFAATGTYFFFDSYIPIAVFLAMHLLFTDPSTSPRTDVGRVIFGVLYGASVMGVAEVLGRAGLPTFYDKLLQVPVLNLSIKAIDRIAEAPSLRRLEPGTWWRSLTRRQHHLAYMSVWAIVFTTMSVLQGVGDNHRGQTIPFWQQACDENRRFACYYLNQLERAYCNDGSGWACNELGRVEASVGGSGGAAAALERGCRASFPAACDNANRLQQGNQNLASAPPTIDDYAIILRAGKAPLRERSPSVLLARACRQGWLDTCETRLRE